CQFLTALIFYHIVSCLSRTFFKKFFFCNVLKSFFSAAFNFLLFVVVFATAILDYHIFSDLSTTFLFFSKYFLEINFFSFEILLPIVSFSLLQQL
ncbi:hypothetical protein, partial [Blautia producta]|uniref:hypothetical protein n=1 Tax=Blautia producta TaxID=33035 RepID=UPI0031B5914C